MAGSGTKKEHLELRVSASIIWNNLYRLKGQHRVRAAAEEFRRTHGDAKQRPGQFCKFWGERFTQQGSVHDAARSGRRRKVTAAAAKKAAALLRAPERLPGWPQNGYTSCGDACMRCPELDRIRLQADGGNGCTYKTLWRAAKRADPLLCLHPIRFKPLLSQVNRLKRLQHSKINLRLWRESRQRYK